MLNLAVILLVSLSSKSLLLPHPTEVKLGETLRLQPVDGHHFELKARQVCAGFEFAKKTELLLECKITAVGDHKITVNICKNDKAYCKPESFTLKAVGVAEAPVAVPVAKANVTSRLKIPAGFFKGSFESAVQLAKQKNKIILLNFTAGWCPPCNRNKDFLFPTPGFKRTTASWILYQVDVDELSSTELKDQYSILGYPTLVALTPELQEIHRYVGDLDEKTFVKFAAETEKSKKIPIQQLTSLPKSEWKKRSIEERVRMATHFMNGDDYESTLAVTGKNAPDELKDLQFRAKLSLAIDQDRKIEQRKLIENLFKNGIPAELAANRLMHWAELDQDAAAKYLTAVQKQIVEKRKALPQNLLGRIDRADSYGIEAELLFTFNKKGEAKKLYEKAGQEYEKVLRSLSADHRRYMTMSAGSAYAEADRWDKVIALYQPLAKVGDTDPTFMVKLARAYFYQEKFELSLKTIDKVRPQLYGDNLLRAADFRADVLIALKKNAEAKEFLLQTLKEFSVPSSHAPVSTHRLYNSLKARAAEIEKS